MSINPFFNKFSANNEQNLYEGLIIESIQIHGLEIEYLPRELKAYDEIYGSDTVSEYNSHYPIEMYVKSVDGFEGDGTFLSKFGLEIRDQVTLSVAVKRFNEEIGIPRTMERPNEGDLLYFPLGKRVFFIKFVNHRPQFYPLGHLNLYDLVCESWEYGSELLNTGIPEVDIIMTQRSQDTAVTGNTNFDIPWDVSADNAELQEEANDLIDFTEDNPFGQM